MADNRPSRGRAPGKRVIATRRKETPRWVWIGLIVSPIILIVLVLTLQAGKTPSDAGVGDPNQEIARLESEVGDIRNSFREFFKLARAERFPSSSSSRRRWANTPSNRARFRRRFCAFGDLSALEFRP